MIGVHFIVRISLQISKADEDVVQRCLRDGVVFHSSGDSGRFHPLKQNRNGQHVRLDMPHQLPIALLPELGFRNRRMNILHHSFSTVSLATHVDHVAVTKPVQIDDSITFQCLYFLKVHHKILLAIRLAISNSIGYPTVK